MTGLWRRWAAEIGHSANCVHATLAMPRMTCAGQWVACVLVLLHTAAALWHHVRKDAVLSAMLPRRRSRQTTT